MELRLREGEVRHAAPPRFDPASPRRRCPSIPRSIHCGNDAYPATASANWRRSDRAQTANPVRFGGPHCSQVAAARMQSALRAQAKQLPATGNSADLEQSWMFLLIV